MKHALDYLDFNSPIEEIEAFVYAKDEGTGRFEVCCQECGAEEAAHTVSCADGELLLGEDCVERLFARHFVRDRKTDVFTKEQD